MYALCIAYRECLVICLNCIALPIPLWTVKNTAKADCILATCLKKLYRSLCSIQCGWMELLLGLVSAWSIRALQDRSSLCCFPPTWSIRFNLARHTYMWYKSMEYLECNRLLNLYRTRLRRSTGSRDWPIKLGGSRLTSCSSSCATSSESRAPCQERYRGDCTPALQRSQAL